MGNLEYLKPCHEENSIKEVVITIFLKESIKNIHLYRSLIESTLKDDFSECQDIFSKYFEIGLDSNPAPSEFDSNLPILSGLRFIKRKGNNISRLAQIINDQKRTFISYHSLDYHRWNDFLDDALRVLNNFVLFDNLNNANALSLHYIDEFTWDSKDEMPLDDIFIKTPFLQSYFMKMMKLTMF